MRANRAETARLEGKSSVNNRKGLNFYRLNIFESETGVKDRLVFQTFLREAVTNFDLLAHGAVGG